MEQKKKFQYCSRCGDFFDPVSDRFPKLTCCIECGHHYPYSGTCKNCHQGNTQRKLMVVRLTESEVRARTAPKTRALASTLGIRSASATA